MKKNISKITCVLILFTFGYFETLAQMNISSFQEKIELFTDRTLYIAGEKIQFAAYLFPNGSNYNISFSNVNNIDDFNDVIKNMNKIKLSNVIYAELITPDGEKIAEGKFLVENSYSSGCFDIPKDILNGMYYVRAYTKQMRNYGPNGYKYISIKIVNPYKLDVITYNDIISTSRDSITHADTTSNQKIITLLLDKKEYATRDSVKLQIKGLNFKSNSFKELNISVIPEYSYAERNTIQPIAEASLTKQYYYPEISGLSITGRINDSKSEKTLPFTTVNLSILGDCKDFMAVKTDSSGHFFLRMPNFKGVRDVFLCTETMVDSKSTILIDNDFCQSKVRIPTPSFHLNEMERKTAYDMALNVQISSNINKKVIKDTTRQIDKPFYGEPQLKLVLDQYIQLPSIEDYVTELIPILYIKKHQGKKYFKIYSTEAEMVIYKPLVLLDLVAIDDPEKILSLPPQSISYIEIINAPYVKGNNTYGGIISFFSKKGDFAGIDLPSSGIFLDFNFLSDCNNNQFSEAITKNQPDTRNTLMWEPKFSLNTNNSKTFTFKTPDTPGKYIVLLRGITNKGEVLSYKKSFSIGNKSI